MNQLRKVLPWVGNRADPYYNLNTDESQITEAMNFAWAWHEIVGGEHELALLNEGGSFAGVESCANWLPLLLPEEGSAAAEQESSLAAS